MNISLRISGSWDFYLIVCNVDLIGTYTLHNFTFFFNAMCSYSSLSDCLQIYLLVWAVFHSPVELYHPRTSEDYLQDGCSYKNSRIGPVSC